MEARAEVGGVIEEGRGRPGKGQWGDGGRRGRGSGRLAVPVWGGGGREGIVRVKG